MFTFVLIAAFVVVCCMMTFALVVRAIRAERRTRKFVAEQVAEDVRAGVFDAIVVPRMSVPRRRPILRTRNSKVW